MEENKKLEKLILKYSAALKSLETQINILLQDFELENNYNPVEHIKTRLKSYDSAAKKLTKKGYEITTENIEKHVHDMVGIRIICSFLSDVKKIVKLIEDSDQITVHDKEDYITNPKTSGYSSYHLSVYVPVYLIDGVTLVEAEIQIRTVAMDFWASLDHKITYKFQGKIPKEIREGMQQCAEDIHNLDKKMLDLNKEMQIIKDDQEII